MHFCVQQAASWCCTIIMGMSLHSTVYGSVTSGPFAVEIPVGSSSYTQSPMYLMPAAARSSSACFTALPAVTQASARLPKPRERLGNRLFMRQDIAGFEGFKVRRVTQRLAHSCGPRREKRFVRAVALVLHVLDSRFRRAAHSRCERPIGRYRTEPRSNVEYAKPCPLRAGSR